MALEIDGFAVFQSIGSHRAAFAGIGSDHVKAARTLVVKLIKDKKTGLSALRDIRTALGGKPSTLLRTAWRIRRSSPSQPTSTSTIPN